MAENPLANESSFWRRPWVQDVLPFLTSLSIHAAIVVSAVAVAVGGNAIYRGTTALETQVLPADAAIVDAGPPGGVERVGIGPDPTRSAAQDEFPEAGAGWAPKPGEATAAPSLAGGGEGTSDDPVIGISPTGGGISIGNTFGPGAGTGRGPGTGSGRGPLAPFGTPGGGGFMTIKAPPGGGSASIVYVCDASGSMINTFASLKEQLTRSIQGLKSVQGFNVIFFQDERCSSLADGLLFATPENKRRAFKWLDEQTTTGTTNPIPGIELAFRNRPQLIYLLTDADFPDNNAVKASVARLNAGKQTRINTIIFVPGDGDDDASASFKELMKEIAKDNGGVFAHVKENELR
jgi:hypothetical protein